MRVTVAILGLLLILQGGGCTVAAGVIAVNTAPATFFNMGLITVVWLMLGLAPLWFGYLLFREVFVGARKGHAGSPPPGQEEI